MLSYVIPAHETPAVQVNTSSRNLNLNISPQYEGQSEKNELSSNQIEPSQVDVLLANVRTESRASVESCNERTQLLIRDNYQHLGHQNISNNNNISVENNSCGDTRGGGDGEYETIDSDISELQAISRYTEKKSKMTKLGSKGVGLKRVSFGSSKGSMVETLVFETPTPLSEHVEPTFGFEVDSNTKTSSHYKCATRDYMDDSGIDIQEESERSIVRVSIYQSNQPQQICAPEYYTRFDENLDNSFSNNYNFEDIMATVSTIPGYDRQLSTDSGWDNPFRPGGDLSREADEIVNMIRGGKPITPTEDHSLGNGTSQREDNCNGTAVTEGVTKINITQNQSAQNGTNVNSQRAQTTSKSPENNGVASSSQISKKVVPGPTSASHVVIDEKKNKKKGCCVIQ